MKKMNIILDETTILNFPFLWKLVLRYYRISFVIPVLGALLALQYYISQNSIYTASQSFKNIADEADSPTNAIAKLLGENTNRLSTSEVIGMVQGADFISRVSANVVDHPKFEFLNFNGLGVKNLKTQHEMFGFCKQDHECLVNEVQKVIGQFFEIEHDHLVENRFYLKVKMLDRMTAVTVLKIVAEQLELERLRTIKHFIQVQQRISDELIHKKKEELNNIEISSLKDESNRVFSDLEAIKLKVASAGKILEIKKYELNKAEATLKQTENISQGNGMQDEKEQYNQYITVKKRVTELVQDIHALELNQELLSEQDHSILKELKRELRKKRKELKNFKNIGRGVANIDEFLESKDRGSNFTEFDLEVIKREYKKIFAEYTSLEEQKNELVQKKIKLDHKHEELRPAFEYLKLLESKTIQLKLVESTIVSDLVFDKHVANVAAFKRATKEKVSLFAILLILFCMFVCLLVRYMTDSRIYDEYELSRNFEDLEIIGNTPDFHQ